MSISTKEAHVYTVNVDTRPVDDRSGQPYGHSIEGVFATRKLANAQALKIWQELWEEYVRRKGDSETESCDEPQEPSFDSNGVFSRDVSNDEEDEEVMQVFVEKHELIGASLDFAKERKNTENSKKRKVSESTT